MERVRTGLRRPAAELPGRRQRRPGTAQWRLILLVLLTLGLALGDLTIVRASVPSATATSALAASSATFSTTWAASCGDEACHPAALAASADRPNAVRARLAGAFEAGATRTSDPLARIAPLALLPVALPMAVAYPVLRDLPLRPARAAGADSSIPRPPPR